MKKLVCSDSGNLLSAYQRNSITTLVNSYFISHLFQMPLLYVFPPITHLEWHHVTTNPRKQPYWFADKQQELDLPSLRIDDAAPITIDARAAKKKDRVQRGPAAMSHISGVKRSLTHTNSFTGEHVPLYGIETPHEEELGKVSIYVFELKEVCWLRRSCSGIAQMTNNHFPG